MGTADGSRIRDLLIRRGWKTMPRADGSATGGWPAEEEDRDGQDGGGSCCCCCDRRRTTSGLDRTGLPRRAATAAADGARAAADAADGGGAAGRPDRRGGRIRDGRTEKDDDLLLRLLRLD